MSEWEKRLVAAGTCTCVWDVAEDPAEANEDGDKIVKPDPDCLAHEILALLPPQPSWKASYEWMRDQRDTAKHERDMANEAHGLIREILKATPGDGVPFIDDAVRNVVIRWRQSESMLRELLRHPHDPLGLWERRIREHLSGERPWPTD